MKKNLVIYFVLTFCVCSLSFAMEETLIDFNNVADTSIDFSKIMPGDYTDEERAEMKMDLNPNFWRVKVNSSSFSIDSKNKSYVKAVKTYVQYEDDIQVLAVRALLPYKDAHSNITITPPFDIPAFYIDQEKNPDDFMGTMFLNKGVIRNVAAVNKIRVMMCGHNSNYSLYVRIRDNLGLKRDVFITYIDFKGWQERVWTNPQYNKDPYARVRREKSKPYYPSDFPYIKLEAFYINRLDSNVAGNFVTMIKDVVVDYEEDNVDLQGYNGNDLIPSVMNQEEIFGIYKEELSRVANKEIEKANEYMMYKWLDKQKMAD